MAAADASLRLEATQGLEDEGAVAAAAGESLEGTTAAAEAERSKAVTYADSLAAERHLRFPCGACGIKYASKDELVLCRSANDLGCPGGEFGWCRVIDQPRKRRRKAPGE